MAEDIRLSVGADTTQMETQIANAVRKAAVVIRPTVDSRGLEKISAPLGRITGQADEFSKSMEAANARVLAFGASVGVLNAVAKSFQSIVTSSTLVEAALREIQVATGDSTGSLEKLGEGIFDIARNTGLSFKQASEATLEFARQGGTLEDSLKKANAALVLTRTTGLDAAEAVKGLTAAVLSFNQVGLDYETVVNKLAAVDTKFAVSSRDLIEGISRSASVAQEAGVSFDELTALITTLQEKTARGGAVIGNALKTIFQRVQTTDNLKYIRGLGIAVTDASNDILPATKIIRDLADEFKNLDSATRKELLIKIGGGFQIDKLAALLNDISNANGTFERSLNQSLNAGNQGFAKVEQLNKTVQASFDRLATSGTEFAATIGKIAFSDDFRSILNKTSSFLETLNENVSGGEEGGATIGKALVKGIGSILTGPGALLLAGLGIKLFGDLAKFGVDSLKNQLGVTNVKKEQQDIEKSILGLLLQNTAVQTKILSLEGNKTAQAEYLLSLYSKQAATLERMSKLSKEIGPSVYEGGIRLTPEGTKQEKVKNASGGFMPKEVARAMEMREAPAGASIREISNFNFGPKEGRGTMIVNSMESVHRTPMGDFVIPSYSKTRTGKPTLFSAAGYIPNFAEEKEVNPADKALNIDAGAYSFAGLTIGGTGTKQVRGKALTPNLLQKIKEKDPVLTDALSKYSKINFQNVSVGNVYRRRDENLDSLEANESDIKNHFIQKANNALSPQIGSFIKDELDSLGIKPTPSMQLMMKSGMKFNFINESTAGTFFENMLKMANMSVEDDNFGQFFTDETSRFDIYGLKPEIAEQYGLPKRFWEYVEIKSSEKALNDELGDKFIQQVSEPGGEPLKSKLLNQAKATAVDSSKKKVEEKVKSASRGYVPNFAIEPMIKKAETVDLEAEVQDFKNLENAKFADPDDQFKAKINVKRLQKNKKGEEQTISFFQSKANSIARELIGNKEDGYKDPKIKKKYFREWKKAGVDPSSLSYIETLYEDIKPKNKKPYKDKFVAFQNRIQGALGEISASKALGKKLTTGNAYFDLPNQTEVRTRQTQSAFDILRKGVNSWLSVQPKNFIADGEVQKVPLKDLNLVLPSDSTFTASEGYVPNFAIKELKNAPVMTIGDRVKRATTEQLKYRLGGDKSYTTDLAGTKVNENLDINKIKNDMAASILGPNYHLLGNDGNLDTQYYRKLMSAFTSYKTGKTNKTAFGEMPEIQSDENKAVTGEVSGFARELKYEKLGQIFDIIAKNRNMQDAWTEIFQTKASAGIGSVNTPDQESKISKLVTQFRPVVIDELTKRLKTKVSAIMTTIGRDDAEFLALGKSVNIDEDGNLLLPDKLKVDQLQKERRFVMPLQTPENLKRVGKSKLDRIVLNDPKKQPSEGKYSTFNLTKLKASNFLDVISQREYPYGSYQKTREDVYTGRQIVKNIIGWKGENGIEARLSSLAEENPFLAKKIKSFFSYDKKKMVIADQIQPEVEKFKTVLQIVKDFGISDWDNINFEKSLQTYAPTKTAAEGFAPNLGSTQELKGEGIGMLYEDPKNFKEVGGGQSGKFLAPLSGKGFGQKIFYKPGSEKISQEYNVNTALKQFEKQNPALFKQNAISFTNVGNLLSKNNLLAGFEREFIADSGVDEFVTTRLKKKPSGQIDFAFYLSERMAQQGIDNILKSYKDKYGADSIRLYDVYAGNFKVNEVMQDYIMQKTAELFKGGDGYSEASKVNANELNKNAGSKGGLHTMYDTMGATNIAKTAAMGHVPNFAKKTKSKKVDPKLVIKNAPLNYDPDEEDEDDEEDPTWQKQDDPHSFFATIDNKNVGELLTRQLHNTNGVYVEQISIDPEHRNKGYAKALYAELKKSLPSGSKIIGDIIPQHFDYETGDYLLDDDQTKKLKAIKTIEGLKMIYPQLSRIDMSRDKAFTLSAEYSDDVVTEKTPKTADEYKSLVKLAKYDPDAQLNLVTYAARGYVPNFAAEDVDGDGTVTRNDPFIKKLMESLKKFSPVGKELTNNIVGNLLNLPEGIDVFEIIDQLKFAMKAQEPERELSIIKNQAEFARKYPKKAARIKEYLEAEEARKRNRTAAKGYIPNFSKDAILDAIGREQKESGLPLSAIKVVQDARVRGPQNPDGYAVINNRDEPDGRVPNFADPSGKFSPEVFNALENAILNVINSSKDLTTGFNNIAENMRPFGVSLKDVTEIAEKMTSPLNEVANSAKQAAEASAKNTDQQKDNAKQENDSSKGKVNTNEEEKKTVQDSLFTLLKWQTVIAGVTGALSTLGGGFDVFGRSLGSVGNTLITFREGKNIVKEFLGTTKNEKGEEIQNTFSDILKNIKNEFATGKGTETGVSGNVAGLQEVMAGSNIGTGLKAAASKLFIGATVATEVYGAIDAVWTYLGDGAKEQEDAVLRLNEAMKDYNLTLSEQAKLISKRGIEKFSSEGNSKTFKGFLSQVGVSMGQAVDSTATEELQKKIDILLSSTANRREGKTGSQIAEQIINSDKKLASKVTAETLTSSGFADTKDIILPLYQAISEIETSKNKLIPEGDKNKLTSSQVQENVDAEIERQIATLFGKTGVEFEKGVVELIKKATPKAQQASTKARELTPSFGFSTDVLKTQLDNQYQIQKILRDRTSIAENQLSLEKELLTTSESRRANLEYELKIIDLQKQRQGEIQDIVFEASKNKVNQTLQNRTNIDEGQATKIKEAFEKITTVTNEDDLVRVYAEIQEKITGIKDEDGKIKTLLREELEIQKNHVSVVNERFKTKKSEIDIENQKLAILAKRNFIENNAREFLNLQIAAQQRLLDQDKQRLDLQNQISDIMYETANLPTPNQDSYIKERSDLLRSLQTGGTRKEQELDFQRRSALQSDRSTALNVAFQKGATAEDVQSIVKADTYDALQEALQKVLNKQSSEINQKVTDAGNAFKTDIDAASNSINDKIIEAGINFFNKTDDAATNMGQKFASVLMATLTQPSAATTTIAQTAQSNTAETKTNASTPEKDFANSIKKFLPLTQGQTSNTFDAFKTLNQNQISPKSLLAPTKSDVYGPSSSLIGFSLPPVKSTTSVATPLEAGPAAKALPAQAFLQASPSAVSNQDKEREKFARESEFKLKQLVFSAERRAIEKKLESENASISNAQKLIELRKQERDWQQRVRDSAFEVYKTQLSPYQAEKQTTFRGIETERVQAVQDNRDQIESAKLQAKQNQLQALQSRGATLKQINEFQSGKKEGGEILKELQSQVSIGDKFSNKVESAADYFDNVVRKIADGWNAKFNKVDGKQEKSITSFGSENLKKDILSVKIEDEIKSDFGKPSFSLPIEENKKPSSFDSTKLSLGGPAIASEKNPSFESNIDTQKLREQYITAEKYNNPNLSKEDYQKTFEFISNTQQAVPTNREREINTIAANRSLAASKSFSQQENFGEGFKVALRDIDDELTKFDAVLGRQIPMNFRDGLVDAMRVLTDPNATTSLKERLLGVASAFLNKINEALMQNVANQFTKGITGLGGISGFASGGPIEGGSGTKDDVPAMLMGGEYVIKKSSVNKYGKDFFDELNAGKAKIPNQDQAEYLNKTISKKVKKFAAGGLVETDLNDLIKNPAKYSPYGQNKIDGISFDQSGKAIDIENYKGPEENKQDAIVKAQSDFYAKNQQTGEGGFFMPGTYGKGAIMGQKNLLAYATQQTVGTQYDKISSGGGSASIDLAAGSGNLSLFALRDQGNTRNAEYLDSKNKALDLYFQGVQASKDKIRMDYDNQKAYEEAKKEYEKQKKQARKAMLVNLGVTVGMAGISALGSAASAGKTAAQQAYASGQAGAEKPGFFTGMWSGAKINGETFGGVKNAFKFDSNALKTANLLGAQGGALSWNSKDRSYQPLTETEYNKIAPAGASWSKGSVGTPYSWQSQRRAAGGFVAGNGMGDNVPTMLNGGEFVVSRQAAEKTGYNNLQKINSTGEVSEGSGEMTSRLESKLEELVEKISGVGTINISVNSNGSEGGNEREDSSKQDQQNKELARKIKDVVLSVLRDEKRLGGMLR
jgi:TP901 family phage tail tape measure protein